MTNKPTITVKSMVNAPIEKVWECWTAPEHIVNWAFASDDWEAPAAENDVRVGGKFKTVMAAKDSSAGFDFSGIYTVITPHERIEYTMDDGRTAIVQFEQVGDDIQVTETFEMENENSADVQRTGWQTILDNFKKHVETNN